MQGLLFDEFRFPAGESHCRLSAPVEDDDVLITARIKCGDDVMALALKVDAARRAGARTVSAFLPYMPYARQDRVAVSGEPLSIRVFADILNALRLKNVYTIDAHSDVVAAVVNGCENVSNAGFIRRVLSDCIIPRHGKESIAVVSPDAGQAKKIYGLSLGLPVIQGTKHRDVVTGKLSGFGVANAGEPNGKVCLIVDDILDGGGTFVGLSKVLRERGASHVYLACTHGIFSKGAGLCDEFDRVFVTDTYQTPPTHDRLSGYAINITGHAYKTGF